MTISNFQKINRGFTLMETLVAISILLIAVVGPVSLIGDSLHKIYYAKDEMIAINLAQEGIEAAREVRDSNMLAGATWNATLLIGSYVVDVANIASGSGSPLISLNADSKVYFDGTLYRQGAVFATTTPFTRVITISSTGLPLDELKVTSTVTWKTGGDAGTISVSENLFKWAL